MHPNYQLRHSHPVHTIRLDVSMVDGIPLRYEYVYQYDLILYESIFELVRDDCFVAVIDTSDVHVYNISHLHAAYPT